MFGWAEKDKRLVQSVGFTLETVAKEAHSGLVWAGVRHRRLFQHETSVPTWSESVATSENNRGLLGFHTEILRVFTKYVGGFPNETSPLHVEQRTTSLSTTSVHHVHPVDTPHVWGGSLLYSTVGSCWSHPVRKSAERKEIEGLMDACRKMFSFNSPCS